jgi:hypothetical protein
LGFTAPQLVYIRVHLRPSVFKLSKPVSIKGFLSRWTATVSGTASPAAARFTIRHHSGSSPLKLAHDALTRRAGTVA